MEIQKNRSSWLLRMALMASIILLIAMNFNYITNQNEPMYWVHSSMAIISIMALYYMYRKSPDENRKEIMRVWMILISYLAGWLIFGINNGYNSQSLHIYHAVIILVSIKSKNRNVSMYLLCISYLATVFLFFSGRMQFWNLILYLFIVFGAYVHSKQYYVINDNQKELTSKVNELETLYAITRALDSFPDLDSVLKQITRIVTHGIGIDVCAVLLYSQDSGNLELKSRYPENLKTYALSPEVGLAGEVFRTGNPIVCGNLNENVELLDRIALKNGENACCLYPLEHHDERFGVIVFTNMDVLDMNAGIDQFMRAVTSTVSMVISNALHHEIVAKSAQIDELTGLYNRAYFYNVLDHEIRKAKFTGQSVYVLVLDIDKFKKVNDTYGHLVGDRVLELIGNIILSSTRKSDIASRYGGEEFALIMPNSCYTAAEHLAERIRRSVEKITSEYSEFTEFSENITLSVGIACYPHCAAEPKQIVDMADKRMYAAKRTGGNQYIYESL